MKERRVAALWENDIQRKQFPLSLLPFVFLSRFNKFNGGLFAIFDIFPAFFFCLADFPKMQEPNGLRYSSNKQLIYARLSAFVTSVRSVKRHFSSSVSASNSINQKISLLLFGKVSRFLLYGVTQEQMEWQRH